MFISKYRQLNRNSDPVPQVEMGNPPSRPRARLRGSGRAVNTPSELQPKVLNANVGKTRSARAAQTEVLTQEMGNALTDQVSRLSIAENTDTQGEAEANGRVGTAAARGRGSGRGKRGANKRK